MNDYDEYTPWIISNKIPRRKYRIFQNRDGFYIKRKVFQGWIKVRECINIFDDKFESKYFLTEQIASEYIDRLCKTKCYLQPNQFINRLSIVVFIGALIYFIIWNSMK